MHKWQNQNVSPFYYTFSLGFEVFSNLMIVSTVSANMFCYSRKRIPKALRGGRVERRCWVNFQCRGVLLVWMIVGQGPIVLAVGAGGGCLDIFFLIYHFSFLSPSLWETARYRLKYCLKGPLNPKQPTNQPKALRPRQYACFLRKFTLNALVRKGT